MAAPTITDSVIAVGTGTSVTTGNLTIASGDVLYVGVILSDGSPGGMTSVTSSGGGGALSSIGDSTAVQSFLRLHVYRSTSPTAGTVTITATPAASTSEIAVIAVSVAGVDSGTPNGTMVFSDGNGTADAASGTVSSGTDAIVLDWHGRFLDGTFGMTAGGAQTILDQANYNNILSAGSSWEAGAASVTTDWSRNSQGTISNYQWVIGALSINGATGGTSMPCDAGSFTLTGGDITFRRFKLTCDAGSFTLTGSNVGLAEGSAQTGGLVVGSSTSFVGEGWIGAGEAPPSGSPYTLTIEAGSFALTGGAVTLRQGYVLPISAGSFTLTGSDAARDLSMALAAGSFTLTGQDVTLTPSGTDPVLTADAGSFTLTGGTVGLAQGYVLPLDAGSFTLSGTAVGLRAARTLSLAAGSFSLSGTAVGLAAQRRLALAAGSFTLTGSDVTLTPSGSPATLTADAGTFTLTGGDVGLRAARTLALAAGSFALSGQAVTLQAARQLALDSGAFTLAGSDITLTPDVSARLTAEAGVFTLTGGDVTFIAPSTGPQLPSAGMGGGGSIDYQSKKRRKPKLNAQIDKILDDVVAEVVYKSLATTDKKKAAGSVVKPYSETPRKSVPEPATVDWNALTRDSEAVGALLQMWRAIERERELDEDEESWLLLGD
jgi:hypothetical protein